MVCPPVEPWIRFTTCGPLPNRVFLVSYFCSWKKSTIKSLVYDAPNHKLWIFLVSSCSCLCPIHWSQVLCRERRCSWSSADRRCSNYIWAINHFIAYRGAPYIRGFTVLQIATYLVLEIRWPLRIGDAETSFIFWHNVDYSLIPIGTPFANLQPHRFGERGNCRGTQGVIA